MGFYGREYVPESIRRLYSEFLHCWSRETCAPRMRDDWSEENPTLGQCSITSFIVQDMLGGEVMGIPLPGGGAHCFNVVNGVKFDLTSEQFGDEALDYENVLPQSREEHFADGDKFMRYGLLKSRLIAQMGEDGYNSFRF